MRQASEFSSLSDWIESEGVITIAKLLKVNPNTVRYWRSGHALPKTDLMREIKKVTKGRVGYEQIIDGRKSKKGCK